MFYSNKKIIQILGTILYYKKIIHIVLSPGSRNAPIILHFTQQKIFKTYSIVDERCAAFFALGMIQSLQKPVVINCTSGSSIANYYPAVTESFYQNIPLIIITADRPKEYIDIYEGQTIHQENFFNTHIQKSVQLTEDVTKKGLLYNARLINITINEAIINQKPVHINIPISEPLYETTDKLNIKFTKIIHYPCITPLINKSLLYKYKKIWKLYHKKMIIIGQCNLHKKIKKILKKLSKDTSIIILTETLSNIHISNNNIIKYIDRIIIPLSIKEWKILVPDILLTIGKNIISKKIKLLLKKSKIKHHWHIENIKGEIPDTYQKLTLYCNIIPEYFLYFIQNNNINQKSTYQKKWIDINRYRQKKHDIYLKNINFSDMKVLNQIFKSIPINERIQLSNSSIIRYQQFLYQKKFIFSYSNRGTSGIDGSVSTAIGFSVVSKFYVTLITGDLSFFYDSNALWNNYIPPRFRIILINNGGGNIFKLINHKMINSSFIFQNFIESKHNLNAKYICKTYNIDYLYINNFKSLIQALKLFWNFSKKPKLIEINTKNCNNELILKEYYKYIV